MKNFKTLAAVMAMVLAFSLVGCGSSESQSEGEKPSESVSESASESSASEAEKPAEDAKGEGVMTHADYIAAEMDSEIVVETYVQAKQSYYAEKGTATLYTQDNDGAYFLYNAKCTQEEYDKLVPGTKIKAKGFKGEFSGEVEILDAEIEILDGSYTAEPIDATELLANEEELIKHQNELASFKGLTVEDATEGEGKAFLYNYDGSGTQGDDLYFYASSNGNKYKFTVESYLCNKDSDVYKAVEALKVGDVIDMEGFLYWYEGVNPHITSVTVK